ncbi:single-stranded DNA-binding protein [Cryobacterium sp. GrIS_2_6]|uniref:single-stranded DNA-binding protein n=1 Tax=Cryobacterium sp. GrIS_2_6 TaxID=3162785 RepID=UPI002E05212A|nr:single-stranded DNA-binding protein [Cryobacterium psychrotolerans]MEC5149406.1 single-strand DNA-binding protein [Cryobacterium psychrotolerans]
MSNSITVTGIVATTPRHLVTSAGLAITSFRLASGQRRYDRTLHSWVDADTNWYTVTAFRHLAHNVVRSVRKGEHVLVAGQLRVRAWQNAERSGTSVEVEAEAVGHDLSWCTTNYLRPVTAAAAVQGLPTAPDPAAVSGASSGETVPPAGVTTVATGESAVRSV